LYSINKERFTARLPKMPIIVMLKRTTRSAIVQLIGFGCLGTFRLKKLTVSDINDRLLDVNTLKYGTIK